MDDSWIINAVYWAALHNRGDEVFDEHMHSGMEVFVEIKMKQLEAYNAGSQAREI